MVAETRRPIRCDGGLTVTPDHDFADCPPLDVLLVPGGPGTRREVSNASIVEFIKKRGLATPHLLSVCTGAFLLHAAGLLTGRRATTHWASLERLRALGDVEVVEERFVKDGHIWSSAGVSAGIDMALAFLSETMGEEIAGEVQLGAEFYPDDRIYRPREDGRLPRYVRG